MLMIIYLTVSPVHMIHATKNLESCLADLRSWMTTNYFKLNEEKTEFLTLGSNQQLRKVDTGLSLKLGSCNVCKTQSARNLGVVFNSTMSVKEHVSAARRTFYFHVHNISKIRYLLDLTYEIAKLHVQTHVLNRLDFCNSVLFGITKKNLARLQRVQNSAARLVTRHRRTYSISPILHSLHYR